MTDKVTYAELVALIQSGSITKQQIKLYFELDPIQTSGLQLVFQLNPDTVDLRGVEITAATSAHQLALQAERAVQQERIKLAAAPKDYAIIAEGDSWFSHPLNTTVIDVLQSDGNNINNMATAGDTLENMVTNPQYIGALQTGAVANFLFSGGGNDVIGRLSECVNIFDIGHKNPENPSDVTYYIKPEYYTLVMPQIKNLYHELISQVRNYSPATILMLHGYAHARPFAHGPFLGIKFDHDLGFDMLNDRYKALAWRIVMKLVDVFDAFLISLAKNVRNVEFVDFRSVVRTNLGPPQHRTFGINADWFDSELHPSPSAAKRMAEKYQPKLPQPSILNVRDTATAPRAKMRS